MLFETHPHYLIGECAICLPVILFALVHTLHTFNVQPTVLKIHMYVVAGAHEEH